MTQYHHPEIEFLHAQNTFEHNCRVPVLVKKSPTARESGWLDAHELAVMQEHWATKTESEEEKAQKAAMTPEESVQAVRDSMGFPNRNLCTEEIYTRFETIRAGENEVGLWRYYKRFSERKPGKPCLVFFHGGGWMGGTPYTVENPCRLIAQLGDAVVVNGD